MRAGRTGRSWVKLGRNFLWVWKRSSSDPPRLFNRVPLAWDAVGFYVAEMNSLVFSGAAARPRAERAHGSAVKGDVAVAPRWYRGAASTLWFQKDLDKSGKCPWSLRSSLASRTETLVVEHPSLPRGLEGLTGTVKVTRELGSTARTARLLPCLHASLPERQPGKKTPHSHRNTQLL